jgi:hypothetical protein
MATLKLINLISRLEDIDSNLGKIWVECKNIELSEDIETQRYKLQRLIESLYYLILHDDKNLHS